MSPGKSIALNTIYATRPPHTVSIRLQVACDQVWIRHPTKCVVTKTELHVHRPVLTDHFNFYCLFYLDLQLRKIFHPNESEFLLQEIEGQNFVQIPPENFHNGLNDITVVI